MGNIADFFRRYIALQRRRCFNVVKNFPEAADARSRDSARLVSYTPPEILPATVIAYERYEDSDRDLEIVARNKIARPGFVATTIQVLSR